MSICVMARGDGSIIETSSVGLGVFIHSNDESIWPSDSQVNLYISPPRSEASSRKAEKVPAIFARNVALMI
jgi:hypothetical protein